MGDNITKMVAEGTMVMLILARIYKYRVSSSLRWREEMLEDSVECIGKDTKELLSTIVAEVKQGYCDKKKHLIGTNTKNNG